jgi:hypothetical protein
MKKLFMAILALAGASSLMMPVRVHAQTDGVIQEMMPDGRAATRAARLRTSNSPHPGNDPDTVWIGHVDSPAYTAGGKMPAGGAGPYHVGRGDNFPKRSGLPVKISDNGTWSFDVFQPGETDSLFGWWPIARPFQSIGGSDNDDYQRPFLALDFGNQVNYVINQGSPKRTFGVVGVWHRDPGSLALTDSIGPTTSVGVTAAATPLPVTYGRNVQPVLWSPVEFGGAGSTASAWMGVRSNGDLTVKDETSNGGTGNAFNGDLFQYQGNNGFNQVGSTSANGTDHLFPGYGSQMDQMLYRDVQLAPGDGLNISFNYATNMSLNKITAHNFQSGWFNFDPISPARSGPGQLGSPTSDGNYISAVLAGANQPCDSFMVYVGAPVNDANVTFSAPLIVNGSPVTTVYDPKRRWFSEVIQVDPATTGGVRDIIGKEILSAAGQSGVTSFSVNIPSGDPRLAAAKAAMGNKVRIVFRVKTNRGYDDENGSSSSAGPFSSGTRGAAIIDNVVVNGWAAANGNFESTSSINNDTSVDPLNAWKSTGKPPAVYWHVKPLASLAFNDPCGGVDNPNRQCNMYGVVATPGNNDDGEKNGGAFGSNVQDRGKWFVSPTINLVSTGNGPGFYNGQGVDDELARTTGDYQDLFSLYNAGFVNAPTATGNFLSVGWQAYPARQANGNVGWGEVRYTTAISFYGTRGCFETFFTNAKANALIRTTNAANRPDSLRLYIQQIQRCFTFTGLVDATCSPTVGDNVGTYWDNISIALVDAPPPAPISIPIWMLINDAFPTNSTVSVAPGEAFDTTGAQVRIGINTAGQTGNTSRPVVTGDSMVITVASTNPTRVDMIFRIKPGPGNYVSTGHMNSGIAKTPNGKVAAGPTGVDNDFFSSYMTRNGYFGSGTPLSGDPNGGPGHGATWNVNLWNSARMDTVEENLYPTANNGTVVGLANGVYASMYHEGGDVVPGDIDAQRFNGNTFNPARNRCFMVVPGGATNSTNIICDGTVPGPYGAASGTTKEYKKIIPDGLLTPGSHVEYFFRRCELAATSIYQLGPDTMQVIQNSEGSTDGHRWQEFSVLPDRWKDGLWAANERDAAAPACMLFIDWEDRRGDERFWVGFADSIGATAPGRYGAHNGWHARGDQDITVNVGTDPTIAVYAHGGQPGTIWDMFGVKASESSTTSGSIGSRGASAPTGLMAGKGNSNGPTGDMLRQYYRILFALTGDLNAGNVGPYNDKGDNDVLLLQDFADDSKPGTTTPRAVWIQGRGFVEGQITGGTAGHPTFPPTFFGAGLASGDYRSYAANLNDIPDLTPNAPVNPSGAVYGVLSNCNIQNDVLTLQGTFGAIQAAKYENSTTNPNPKIASIYAPATPGGAHPHISLVDGFRIQSLGSRNSLQSLGAIDYYAKVFTNLWASLNCNLTIANPVGVGDNPNNALVSFLALRSENPFRSGSAKITFGITKKEKVELKVYDVTGRLVKTLANREFEPGSHDVFWDGSNDDGQLVSRGVYFYQLRTPSFVSQKKLAVLKN